MGKSSGVRSIFRSGLVLIVSVIFISLGFAVKAEPIINFTSPTEDNATTINQNWTIANITIDEIDLNTFKLNWLGPSGNDTNYTIYYDSLVLAMNFNNNSEIGDNSTQAIDISKYGNNGTCYSGAATTCNWTTSGKYYGGMQFDGEDDYLSVGNDTSLNLDNGTIMVWFKTPEVAFSSEPHILVEKYVFLNSMPMVLQGYRLYLTNDNSTPACALGLGESGATVMANSPVETDRWYSLSCLWNGSLLSIARDGVIENSESYSSPINSSSNSLQIGYGSTAIEFNNYFKGTIDEVRIYNRSLSTEEIGLHYQSEFQKYNSTQYRFYANLTNLTDGTYTYYAWANDTSGNSAYTTGFTEGNPRYLYVDTGPPTLILLTLNDTSPVKSGNVTFTLDFSESMNQSINPTVKIKNASEYTLTTTGWSNASRWAGYYNFTTSTGDGNYTINITGAKDAAGNEVAEDTSNSFMLDTHIYYLTDCANLNVAGATYYLTANITNSPTSYCMDISANNVTLDCQNNIIDSTNTTPDYGIYVYRATAQTTNITVKNCQVTQWEIAGIYFYRANGNRFENLNASGNVDYGIYLSNSNSNTLTNITASSNSQRGLYLTSSSSNTISNIISDSNDYGIYLTSSSSNTIFNIISDSNDYGIYLTSSSSNTLSNITANSNSDGLYLTSSSSNTISNIISDSNNYGISLSSSSSNTLTNITASSNSNSGISLFSSSSNNLSNVTAQENTYYDAYIFASLDSDCNNAFNNITGSNNLPIEYYNSSATIENKELSELILCNADDSIVRNVTINASQSKENNGLFVTRASGSNISDIVSSDNYYSLYLESSSSNTISNLTANSNSYYGLYLESSSSNTISNLTANSNSYYGLYLESSSSNTISNITANSNSQVGIYLESSSSNTLTNITASSNSQSGVLLLTSSSNNLSRIEAGSNNYGIHFLDNSDQNFITNSTIMNSTSYGVYFQKLIIHLPENNTIYNCLINETNPVGFSSGFPGTNYFNSTNQTGTRIFGSGTNIGGNFYTNSSGGGFSVDCDDIDNDSFCDSYYNATTNSACTAGTCGNNTDFLALSDEYLPTFYLTDCTNLSMAGATYYLTANITNSATSYCMNISANNVTLDCQNNIIGSANTTLDYGIYVSRASAETANITIRNCQVTQWGTAGIYIYQADGNKLENLNASGNAGNGITLASSSSNTLTNITSNNNPWYGLTLVSSNSNNISNITTDSNMFGLDIEASNSNNLSYITSDSNNYGIRLSSSNSNTLTNITASDNSNIGIHIIHSNSSTISNLTSDSNEYGILLDSSNSNNLTDLTAQENTQYDVSVSAEMDSECDNNLTNITGSNNLPIEYYNYSATIENKELSELILCNADYSIISNVIINASQTENNNALFMLRTSDSILNSIVASNNYYGLFLQASYSNNLTNITANSNTESGISIISSNSTIISNLTANYNSLYGVYLEYSHQNNITDSFVGDNPYGVGIYYDSDQNIISDSTIYGSSTYGVYFGYVTTMVPENNTFYNNLINCTSPIGFSDEFSGTNYFNSTNQTGTRIFGAGITFGGNFYTNSTGGGFSVDCADAGKDGFCDDFYNATTNSACSAGTCGNNTDFLALSDDYHVTSFSVNPNSPENDFETADTTPDFNFTVNGTESTYNCTLYIGGSAYGNNATASNNQATIITANSTLLDGAYSWNITCISAGIINSSVNRTIIIDTNSPNSTALSPNENSYLNVSLIDISFALTEVNLNATNCSIINSSGSVVNSSINTSTGAVHCYLSIYTDGAYNISLNHSDTSGNINQTLIQNVTKDTEGPASTILSPLNDTWMNQSRVEFSYSVTESNMDFTTVSIYNSTGSLVNSTTNASTGSVNSYLSVYEDGAYTFNVTTIDKAGNINQSRGNFTIDSANPKITITSPQENTYTNNTSLAVTYTVTESNINLTNVSVVEGEGIINSTINASTGTVYSYLDIYLNGKYNITAAAYDLAGNINQTTVQNWTLDTISPNSTASSPLENTFINQSSFDIAFALTESNLNLTNCSIINSTGSLVNSTANASNGTVNCYLSAYAEGSYNLTLTHYDKAGNTNQTMIPNVTRDSTSPQVIITSPLNDSLVNTDQVTFSYLVTEFNIDFTNVSIYNSTGSLVNSTINTSTGAVNSYLSVYADGVYTFNVTTYDRAGNINQTRGNFTKDTNIPQVAVTSPLNDTYTNNTLFTVAYQVTESNINLTNVSITDALGSLVNSTTNASVGSVYSYLNVYTNGAYNITATTYDLAGNINQSMAQNITLDTIPPQVSITSPINDTYTNQTLFDISYLVTESNMNLTNISITNSSGSVVNSTTNISTGSVHSYLSVYLDGSYNITATSYDLAGNSNQTLSQNITLDTTLPTFLNHRRNPITPTEEDDLQVNVTLSEINPDTVTLEWNNSVNYTVSTYQGDEYYFTIEKSNYTAHDNLTYYWYANDTSGNLNRSDQQSFTVTNQIPSATAPEVSNTTPRTNDILSCLGGIFSDEDNEDAELSREYRWYDTGILIAGQTNQTLSLSVSGLDKGDNLACSVRVYDGYNYSAWANSSNAAVIENTPPTTPSSINLTSLVRVGNNLNINALGAFDEDNDTITYYYQFYNVNDSVIRQIWSINDTYLIQITDAHDMIRVYTLASDGVANSTNITTDKNVTDTGPTIPTSMNLTSNVRVTGALQTNCTGSSDADLDSITYYYEFYNLNDTSIKQSYSTNNSYLIAVSDAHDIVRIRCKAVTSQANSTEYEQNNSIIDTLPTDPSGSNLTISSLRVEDTLGATGQGAFDEDNDTITYYYEFYNTNDSIILQANSTNSSYLIAASDAHDTMMVRIWSSTLYGDSTGYDEANKSVSNTPPTVPTNLTDLNLHLTNHFPNVSWIEGTDIDGDLVYTIIYVGANSTPDVQDRMVNDSEYNMTYGLTDGNTYYYRLRSFDGQDYSNYTASDEFRMNSISSTTSPVLNPPTVKTLDDLNCTVNYTDTESDAGTVYFEWFKNEISVLNGSQDPVASGSIVFSVLNSTNFVKGDNITCQVYSNDTYESESSENSTQTMISNTAPIINTAFATVYVEANGSSWSYDFNATDPDVDDGTDILIWYDNTTLLDINYSTGEIADTPTEAEAGTYRIEIIVSDGLENDTLEFNYTLLDVTNPSDIINEPVNTYYNYTTLGLNVTANDTNGLDSCWYSLDNWTTNITFNCSTANVTGIEGYNTLRIGVNDTNGNLNNSEELSFWVDITPPAINLTCNYDRIYRRDTLICNCSATDNISPQENLTLAYTENPLTLVAGRQTTSCTARDIAGNLNSSYFEYEVIYPQGFVGGGGSSGGSIMENDGSSVSGSKILNVYLNESGISVEVQLNNTLVNSSLSLEKISQVNLPNPPGYVYQYLNITRQGFENGGIVNATVRFRVDGKWLQAKNVSKIYLYRYSGSEWIRLRTDILNITQDYQYFIAYTNAFSYYAIIGEEALACLESQRRCLGDGLQVCQVGSWSSIEKCINGCNPINASCNGIDSGNNSRSCIKGERRCIKASLEVCLGGNWSESEICASGCDTLANKCIGANLENETPSPNSETTNILMILFGASVVMIALCIIIKSRTAQTDGFNEGNLSPEESMEKNSGIERNILSIEKEMKKMEDHVKTMETIEKDMEIELALEKER